MRLVLATMLLAVAPGFSATQPERSLPLFFFPNTGQTDDTVQYIAQTPELTARFRPDSAVFQVRSHQIAVRFVSANPEVKLEGEDKLAGKINFFLGQDHWRNDVPSFGKVMYRGLYPGINMTFGGTGRSVKSEFLVAAGADPGLIRLEYSEALTIDAEGNLLVGDFREDAPVIYQERNGRRTHVAGRYRILDSHTVGFEIAAYDKSAALVIDPTISYCSYLGGSSLTSITGVAVDSSGNLYVTGWTEALNFPIAGAVQASNQGGVDVIVAKLNPAGTSILYATYIGGKSDDKGAGIAVDSSGQAYVTGSTASTNFPLVSSNRATLGGSTAAFALKLNAAGNTLLYSGYLGGTTYDIGNAIAVDGSGNAYIAGDTQSANFPLDYAFQFSLGGGTDAFVAKLNSAGAIVFSTFLGGSGNEHAGGVAVDTVGDIFVVGGTSSTNFPTVSPIQASLSGTQSAFVVKISPQLVIAFGTYLGGTGSLPQQANAVALDSAGNVYVAGVTTSAAFPVTAGAFQTAIGGPQSAFVTKITYSGSAIVYSTYLGGSSYDWASGIAVDSSGNAYVSGYTASLNFPQASAIQATFNGLYDAFISEVNFAGNGLIFSTFYGGSGSDAANAIALDANANIFVGGQTGSTDLHLVTPIQSSLAASSTGWIMRLGVTALPPTTPAVVSVSPSSGTGSAVSFTAHYSDTGGASTITTAALLVNTSASTGYGCYVTYSPGLNLFSIYNDAGTSVSATVSPNGTPAQNSQCVLNGVGSSGTVSGTSLTVTFSISFLAGFGGAKTVYLLAADPSSNTGNVAEGTYTVTIPSGQPAVDSVSPNAGSGTGATFNFVYADSVSATSLTTMSFLFNTTTITLSNACYVVYNVAANTITLTADNGTGSSSMALGATGSLSNSQCTISGTSAAQSGLSVTLTATVTFKGAFNGLQTIFMYAAAGSLNTGWVVAGTYGALNGGQPTSNSSVPNSGSGTGERFTFTVSDQGGSSYITYAAIVFASTFSKTNSCYLQWDGIANTVSVAYDNDLGQTPYTPGSNNIATNSQCTLNALNTTIVRSTTQVFITMDLTFNSSFFGTKNIYLYASEGSSYNSGWQTVGTWTVTGGASTAVSMSPSSGAGNLQQYVFTVTDSSSQTNISGVSVLFTTGAPNNIANACFIVYNRANITVGLWDDTGQTTLSTKGIGYSTLMKNSQCSIQYTTYQFVGPNVLFTVQIQWLSPFVGPKSVYLEANEPTSNSGWVYIGSWTVQ